MSTTETSPAELDAARARLERLRAFSRSPEGRANSAAWDQAYEQAMKEHPKPFANGFYNRDVNAPARERRQAVLFFSQRIHPEAWASGRIELDWTWSKDRKGLVQLLADLGITHAKTARTETLIELLRIRTTGEG